MKRMLAYLMIAGLLASCTSSVKYIERGDYDAAIRKSVKVLMKKPDKVKEVDALQRAFYLASQQDQDAISRLKMSGQPDIYDDLLHYYSRMDRRQEVVERLPRQVLDDIGFQHVDYSRNLAESKNKAAAFFYAHAESLLKDGDKYSARQAYNELLQVKEYYPVYRDADSLVDLSLYLGTNNVLFSFINRSKTILPEDFEQDLMRISLDKLNIQWVSFDTYPVEGKYYDYTIYLYLKQIDVSPEFVKEERYTETREVEDGFDYVLDKKGNVMKDSLGNDIKVPRYVTLRCDVIETSLHKDAQVRGSLDIVDNNADRLIKTQDIEVQSNFDHHFAVVRGDLEAMSKRTKALTREKPVPFPSDARMIYDTNEALKERARNLISRERSLLVK